MSALMSPTDFVSTCVPDAPLIDVRTPGEYAEGHLAGSVNIDVFAPDFRERIQALKLPEADPVYLYCRSGNRSGQAADLLNAMGHQGAVNIGGVEDLSAAGAEMA